MYRHTRELQFTAKPEKPDALFAAKFQEILGGQFGEMTVMMQYLFQGWNAYVFSTSTNGSRAGEGLRATGSSLVDGEPFRTEELRPLTDDDGTLPAPDPLQFVTYDGNAGPGKPGSGAGGHLQGAQNVVTKVKDALTGDDH